MYVLSGMPWLTSACRAPPYPLQPLHVQSSTPVRNKFVGGVACLVLLQGTIDLMDHLRPFNAPWHEMKDVDPCCTWWNFAYLKTNLAQHTKPCNGGNPGLLSRSLGFEWLWPWLALVTHGCRQRTHKGEEKVLRLRYSDTLGLSLFLLHTVPCQLSLCSGALCNTLLVPHGQ